MKQYKYTINGNVYEVSVGDIKDCQVEVTVNGQPYQVEMEPEKEPEKKRPVVKPASQQPQAAESSATPAAQVNTQNAVKAPLPGVVTEVKVAVGDAVKAGDTVVVLEAMKMANNLQAEKDGKVTAVCVNPGQSVMEGDPLVVVE